MEDETMMKSESRAIVILFAVIAQIFLSGE
jgi:hypothetical protein